MEEHSADLEQRIAVVTGASRGIGAAIAERLATDGCHVVLCARSKDVLDDAAARLRERGLAASALACDLADRESVLGLVRSVRDRFGRVDVLVNNAGVLPKAELAVQVTPEAWDAVLDVNLTAPFLLAAGLRPLMPAGSVVVTVTSTAAYYPSKGLVAYNVSKAALVMLTRVLALEWARDGIRVVGIAPGKIDTEMMAPISAWAASRGMALNPQNRMGEADEVGALVSFVVSDSARYLTGVTVPLDGGELLAYGGGGG
ncbi:SDR family NAD(P)-dependent oxidoreductase [uncultured Jatrophihabitans sp.]|uniref:SDR family NAD(P)-dependent oxidoreductase n=1 Tax=uncultured Jatrophihabitans sp. TaxID=1610747 RepID=UPI0035CBFAF5